MGGASRQFPIVESFGRARRGKDVFRNASQKLQERQAMATALAQAAETVGADGRARSYGFGDVDEPSDAEVTDLGD